MEIHGIQKMTLLDYPEKVACTIFTARCNFRCPFCQNGILVVAPGEQPDYSQEELFDFFEKKEREFWTGSAFQEGNLHCQMVWRNFWEKSKSWAMLLNWTPMAHVRRL